MKKVLMIAGKMDRGGLETMLMNFMRNIDSEKVHIDFMVNYEEKGFFDDEIRANGSKIFVMPRLTPSNLFRYISAVNSFFRQHRGEYDVVHGNLTSVGIIYLAVAARWGVKTKIIHAHYADVKTNHHSFLEKIMLFPLRFCADYYFACSDAAGKFCFGRKTLMKNNYKVINNGVNVELFAFDEKKRAEKRAELGVSDNFVLMHVGRFAPEKNHSFLLEVFGKVKKADKSAKLVLVGDGILFDEVKTLAKNNNLSDDVLFLGARDDVTELLQAADVFLLPSIFEGLPVVGVESQTAGLPCIFSNAVTKEVDLTGNCAFLPTDNSDEWIDKILEYRTFERVDTSEKIIDAGFDIREQSSWLERFYSEPSTECIGRKKRIVHVILDLNKGGAERLLVNLACECADKYDITVVSQYGNPDDNFVKTFEKNGAKVIVLNKKVGLDPSNFVKLWRIISDIRPVAVHTHLQSAIYVIPWYFFHRAASRVHTIHTMPSLEFTKAHILLQKFAYHFLRVIPVAITEIIRDETAQIYKLDKKRISLIYNGINTKDFSVHENKDDNTFNIINVASFNKWKNQGMLVDAFAQLAKKYDNFSLTFVGDGLQLENVRKKAMALPCADKINFAGSCDDVAHFLAESDVFVLCSTFEGLPLSVLEAYSTGLPVVATNVGGMPDIVKHGKNGLLVELNDINSLALSIEKLYNDKKLYTEISQENIKKAKEYDISCIAEKYIMLYENGKTV